MNVLITGGLGFVGRHLSRLLLEKGHHVTALGLRSNPALIPHPHFSYLSADTSRPGAWQETVGEMDAVVNLAGKTIFHLWTERYKAEIYDSRILTTRNLVAALPQGRPVTLVSTSAVGYYGDCGEDTLTEEAPAGHDFLARLGRDWEAEALKAADQGSRVVVARFGIVLGADGGALEKMIPAFRSYLGGPLGDGTQWFPWIHIGDLTAALAFALDSESAAGPMNFTAPNPVRNRELVRELARLLNRPALMPAPGFVIRMVLGELGKTLLASQRALPEKLLQAGFAFRFPTIREALYDLVRAAA
ncbi:MAG: TIGR01777 family oxidoreductase [Desulfobacterales bacterium]